MSVAGVVGEGSRDDHYRARGEVHAEREAVALVDETGHTVELARCCGDRKQGRWPNRIARATRLCPWSASKWPPEVSDQQPPRR